jgi:microsomal dipeptidase-like Zn-dependent dipeptidase
MGFRGPDILARVTGQMAAAGYSDDDIRGSCRENRMRVCGAVWR